MVAKDYQKTKTLSTKAEVGEIDTSAPFHSVKDAVSLFGAGAFSGDKPYIKKSKLQSAERVPAKETLLQLAKKELSKLKERLQNAETSKAQALVELEKAKRVVGDLEKKLKIINESKECAIRTSEVAKYQGKQFSQGLNDNSSGTHGPSEKDLETGGAEYMATVTQLNVAKQELSKIHREYHASVEAKELAAKQTSEANGAAQANAGRVDELSKEIVSVQASLQEVNLLAAQTVEKETKIYANKDAQKQAHKARLEESAKKLLALKKEINPEHTKNMKTQLSETLSETEVLRNKMDCKRTAKVDPIRNVTVELDGAKESLNKMVEEERSLRILVETLGLEFENVEEEHREVKEKEAETKLFASNLQMEVQKAKSRLEEAITEEAKARGASDDMVASIQQIVLERRTAEREAQETKQEAEGLKGELEEMRIELDEVLKKLRVMTDEAEEAKVAEIRAVDRVKLLLEKTDAARSSTPPGARIRISRDEFESLSRKVEESEKLADMKVAAAMAQVEAVKAGEIEAVKKLESTRKEIEDMKSAVQEALKKAEMAEAAKKAVEGELQWRREREQKKAEEAASLILGESEKSFESRSPIRAYQIQKQKALETRTLEKAKTSITKKALMPSMASVFQKKKNKVDGCSPSSSIGQ